MPSIDARTAQAFNWKALSGPQMKAMFQAWRDIAQELKTKASAGEAEAVDVPAPTAQAAAPTDVGEAEVKDTQPKVADLAPPAEPIKKEIGDKISALTDAMTEAGPEVVAQAVKLVEEVKSLIQPDDTDTSAPAQRFPSYDPQQDAGKVDATAYARRVAIALQDQSRQMDILETMSVKAFTGMSQGAGGYGAPVTEAAERTPLDLSV